MMSKRSDVAAAWRKSATTELTLPSGAVVEVRIPSLEVYVKYGRLPATLMTKLAEGNFSPTEENPEKASLDQLSKLNSDEFGAFMLFAREMVRSALVSPRIVVRNEGDETPLQDDEVEPRDIPLNDFWAVFAWAAGQERPVRVGSGEVSAAALGNFRADEGVSAAGEGGGQIQVPPLESPENPR
jgi:hypothetical protein